MEAVVVENLSKHFSPDKKAVDGIGFSLQEGDVFGFLGPNGAGKTTTVKLLNGMLSPTTGKSRVFGFDPATQPEKVHRLSGVVTEHAQMYDNMSGLQNLLFYGALFGMRTSESETRARKLLDELGLSEAAAQKLATYSTGMRQRLSLARALIHSPRLLFLDEPTAGLDPESAQGVNRLIRTLAQNKGTTVFLCTHQLRYAQEVCNQYGLIDRGRLLATGDIDTLRGLIFSGMTITIRADCFPPDMQAGRVGGDGYEIKVEDEAEIPVLVRRIVEQGGRIYHVSARKLSLEDMYFTLIERRGAGKEGHV